MMTDITRGSNEIRRIIQNTLEDNEGALIGRNGTTELDLMIHPHKTSLYYALSHNAGIFPLSSEDHFKQWRQRSIDATLNADVVAAGWYKPLMSVEQVALKSWNAKAIQVPLRSLEPYYVEPEDQRIPLLAGHRVAVVSSFTETMKSQVSRLDEVWPSMMIPKTIDWRWIQTGYAPSVAQGICGWPSHIKRWTDAVDYVVSEVVAEGARFALIGCGALSMPIAHQLKQRGVIAIVLGGAIQVLFGMKGSRWKDHSVISHLWNESWVWPAENEIPKAAKTIENGCYWN
jgi:hypothetical protein